MVAARRLADGDHVAHEHAPDLRIYDTFMTGGEAS
jgi:hypothetical protein